MLEPDENEQHFRDMLYLFTKHNVEFMVIGAHALGVHDLPRATGDIDIWVRAHPQNAPKIWTALLEFGAPLQDMKQSDFNQAGGGFIIGLPPGRIDILTTISGVQFDEAWPNRIAGKIFGIPVFVMGVKDMNRNKKAAGRDKDKLDVKSLEKRYPQK